MALQGTLQDFGALEIFQLIALQQKTGTLEIHNRDQVRQFVFDNGLLIAVHPIQLEQDSLLVRFLLELEYIEKDEIPGWINANTHQPVNIIDLVTKMTKISDEEMVVAYDIYIQTILDEILHWPKGRFHFNSGQIGIPSKQVGPWKIEGLLMESMRRLDELADLKAAEMPQGMVPRSSGAEITASDSNRVYRAVHALVDGSRSVHDIITQSTLAGFDICQALRVMRDQNIVEMTEWIPAGVWADRLWKKRSLMKVVSYSLLTVITLGIVTFGTNFYFRHFRAPWETGLQFSFLTEECEASRASYNIATVLETYRVMNHHYPADYDALIENGLLSEKQAEIYRSKGAVWETDDADSYQWWQAEAMSESDTPIALETIPSESTIN